MAYYHHPHLYLPPRVSPSGVTTKEVHGVTVTTSPLHDMSQPRYDSIPNSSISILMVLDRLYLASYVHPPTTETVFPYPEAPARGSPSKRSSRAVDGPSAVSSKSTREAPCYFTVDDQLYYNAFHHDFGPFHIGHLYRFALQFHDVLGAKENQTRPIVFWSRADPRSKLLLLRIGI